MALYKTPASSSQGTTVTQTPYTENQPFGNVRNAVTSPVTDSITQNGENIQGRLFGANGNPAVLRATADYKFASESAIHGRGLYQP